MTMLKNKDAYISLKEAGEISGLAPDYVGQLIRSGKLPGKQVFSNIAWVTTKEAVEAYVKKSPQSKKKPFNTTRISSTLLATSGIDVLYKVLVFFVLAVCVAFLLLLLYVFAVSADKAIDQRSLERLENDK